MRALKGAIPRGYRDHRRTDARRYRAYCEAAQAQWGPMPAVAMPMTPVPEISIGEPEFPAQSSI